MSILMILGGTCLFLLYVDHLVPTVSIHDAGELITGSWSLGIAHPPGSPLYMLVAKLFALFVPYGHIAWRYNCFSLVCALAVFVLMTKLSARLSGDSLVAVLAGLGLALTRVLWSQSETAEVYTLEAALLLAFLLSFFSQFKGLIDYRWPAFLWGLLLTCHVGLAPMTPVVLLLVTWQRNMGTRFFLKRVGQASLVLVLPLLLYFYVPIRSLTDPAIDWGNPETVQNWFWHLTNRSVRGRMLSLPLDRYWARTLEYGLILFTNLQIMLPLSLFGLSVGLYRKSRIGLMLTIILVSDYMFVVFMDNAPLASEAYALPSVIALVILAALGSGYIHQKAGLIATRGLFLLAIAISILLNYEPCDGHGHFLVRDRVENILSEVPVAAVLFTQEDNITFPLAYLRYVEGAREDLIIFDRQANVFKTPYDRPLFLIAPDTLSRFRQSQEEALVSRLLDRGKKVHYTSSFIDFEPSAWRLTPLFYGAQAGLIGEQTESVTTPAAHHYPLRYGPVPDWMGRQILAEWAVHQAHYALEHKDIQSAVVTLELALHYADIAGLLLGIAQLALKCEQETLSQRALEQAVRIDPHFAPAYSLLGYIYFERSDYSQAEHYLGLAIAKRPDLPQPYVTQAFIALRKNQPEQAYALFTQALELNPDLMNVLYNRALLSFESGDYQASRADLEQVVRIDPAYIQAYVLLIESMISNNDVQGAREIMCETFRHVPVERWAGKQLQSLLLQAATLGFPECLQEQLDAISNVNPEQSVLLDSYLKARSAQIKTQRP